MRQILCASSLGLALVLVPFAATAAAGGRSLSGQVLDRSGDPVAYAELVLECPPPAAAAAFTADGVGRFLAAMPAGGACRLTAHPPGGGAPAAVVELGAATSEVTGEAVRDGQVTLTLDLDLLVESIEVRESVAREALESRAIRESFARDAGEALAQLPGIARLRKGGIANDVVLRGQKGENLALRIDGHTLHGACPNRMDPPAFHIDFAEIERIEVTRGPFEAGTGGLGGSIDILTRKPLPGLHVDLLAGAGAWGYVAPGASVAYGGERWSAKAGFSSRSGDAYEDGDGLRFTELLPPSAPAAYLPSARDAQAFDVQTGWVGLGWIPRPGERLELEATRQAADVQLYPYLQMDARSDDATRARATYRALRSGKRLEGIAASFGWSRVEHLMDDRLRVSGKLAPRAYSMITDADAEDGSARGELAFAGGLKLGAEALWRAWETTTRMAGMGYQAQHSLPGTRQRSTALFADFRPPRRDRLAFAAGLRVERSDSSADSALADGSLYFAYHRTRATAASDTLLSGNLGLSWTPDERWEVDLRLGSAARPADLQELFFALRRMGSDWVGNPELASPRQTQLDLSVRYGGERLTFDLGLWAAELDDAVTLVDGARRENVPGVMNRHARTYINHDARMWGAELTARAPLGGDFTLRATLDLARGTRELAPQSGVVDRDLPEIPPLGASLALRWQPERWHVELEGVAAAAQHRVDSGLNETPTPGWGSLNLRAGVEIGRFALLGGIDNLFDRRYREHLSYLRDPFRAGVVVPEPGRAVSLSVRFRT